MNLHDSLCLARKMALKEKKDMVVGRDPMTDQWDVLPKEDPFSDSLKPGIIVDRKGLKYPEDSELVARLIADGANP